MWDRWRNFRNCGGADAYAAYDDREDADKCQAAKKTIEEYRDLECTEETDYAVEYADVLLNCPD